MGRDQLAPRLILLLIRRMMRNCPRQKTREDAQTLVIDGHRRPLMQEVYTRAARALLACADGHGIRWTYSRLPSLPSGAFR